MPEFTSVELGCGTNPVTGTIEPSTSIRVRVRVRVRVRGRAITLIRVRVRTGVL